MRVKTFIGKDRTLEVKRKKQYVQPPAVCRNCGDELSTEGFCVRCTVVLAHYRDVDGAKFAAFQKARGRRV